MKNEQEMIVTLGTSTSAQETCPQEEEAAASSKHNPGDPSLHVLCPAAAWSLHGLSRCSSTEPEPQRHRPQPHALLGDEEVGGGCVSLCSLLCGVLVRIWPGLLPETMCTLGNVLPEACSKFWRF